MKKFAITFQYKVLSEDVPNCLAKITKYMNLQWLKINPDKTEIVLFHPKHLTFKVIIGGVIISVFVSLMLLRMLEYSLTNILS